MVCCFLGSRDISSDIGVKIYPLIEDFVLKGVYDYEIGNQTEFDRIVLYSLKQIKNKYPDICYSIVSIDLSENDTSASSLPQKITDMIDRSDIVVSYYGRSFYNTVKIFEYAKSKNKRIIDLSKL